MKHLTIYLITLMLASPVLAADCHFENAYGETLSFTSPLEITISGNSGEEDCTLAGGGTGGSPRMASCENYTVPLFFVEPELGAEPSILIFDNTAWHEHCAS